MLLWWKITCLAAQNLKQYVRKCLRLVTAFNTAEALFLFAFKHGNVQHLSQHSNAAIKFHFTEEFSLSRLQINKRHLENQRRLVLRKKDQQTTM